MGISSYEVSSGNIRRGISLPFLSESILKMVCKGRGSHVAGPFFSSKYFHDSIEIQVRK